MGKAFGGMIVLAVILYILLSFFIPALKSLNSRLLGLEVKLPKATDRRRRAELEVERRRQEVWWENLTPETPIRVIVAGARQGEIVNANVEDVFGSLAEARAVYPDLDLEKDSERFLCGVKGWGGWGAGSGPVIIFRTPYYMSRALTDWR